MTTLLKKDYQYSSVLWEEVMQRVQEIIRDEYNISPYVSPTLNPKTPSPFRIWSSAQGTDALYVGAWHKEYTISVNHYLKTEDSERFYRKVYEESERLYQLFFNNQGTQSTQTLGFFGGRPEGIQISQEGDYFRIEVLFTCEVLRADDVVYVQALPSEIRATKRALELPFNFWSLDFDGTDDFINTGSYNLTAPFSISIWFQADGMTSSTYRTLFSHSNNLRLYTYGKVLYESGTPTSYSFSASSTSGWQNLVLVDDDSNRSIYLNGSEILSNYKTTSDSTAQSGGVLIGNWSTAISRPMKGRLSEVSVFSSALSSSEISTIYNDGQPILLTENQGGYKSSSNLVSYYRMGSGQSDARGYIGKGTSSSPFVDNLIFDQTNTGLEEELISEIDFNDTDTWFTNNPSFTVSVTSANTFNGNQDLSTFSVKNAVIPGDAIYRFHIAGNIAHGTVQFDEWGGQSNIWAYDKDDVTHASLSGDFDVIFYALNVYGGLMFYTNATNHSANPATLTLNTLSVKKVSGNPGKMLNFDSLDFRTNVPLLYDKALFSNSLVFDGTDDYINIKNFSYDVYNSGDTKPFSISVWFKMNEGLTSDNNHKGALFSDDNNLMLLAANHVHGSHTRIYGLTGGIGESNHGNGWEYYLALDTNWHHIVWTVEKNATNYAKNSLYIDGVQVQIRNGDGGTNGANRGTGTFNAGTGYWEGNANFDEQTSEQLYRTTSTLLVSSGNQTSSVQSQWSAAHIGRDRSLENYFPGSVSDLGFFNVTLDATNVTAIYNSGKPIDLTCDAGNYNNANNLVGYWKMGDGYLDELPSADINGAIVDQVTPIIGDDVLSHNIDDWTLGNNSGATSTKAYSDGVYTITRESEGTGTAYTYIIQSGIENNTLYKVNFSYKTTVNLEVLGTYDTGSAIALSPTTEYIEKTVFILTNSTYAGKFQIRAVGNFQLKNLTYKKVNGNSGLCVNMNASAQSTSVPK